MLTLMFFSSGALALELNGKMPIFVKSNVRTFTQLENMAAEIFNADSEITKEYTSESWTQEFMDYGCYCNKVLRGGGKLPTDDRHEKLCLELYSCYKCINIDYDHTGSYAANEMVYEAEIDTDTNTMDCLNDLHAVDDSRHDGSHHNVVNPANCPRHICECDRLFVIKLLDNHKKCLKGQNDYCLNDTYRKSEGWKASDCEGIGMNVIDHDSCCGEYPGRRPYLTTEKKCCSGELTLSTVC